MYPNKDFERRWRRTERQIEQLFELSRDPMLAISARRILLWNAAAARQFPSVVTVQDAGKLLPDYILEEASDTFLSSVSIDGVCYTVSAVRDGELLLLSLTAPVSGDTLRGCLSDRLMNGMLSDLCNLSLSLDRLTALLDMTAPNARKYLSLLRHSYFCLEHKLSNLNVLCSLGDHSISIVSRDADLVQLCTDLVATVNLLLGSDRPKVTLFVPEGTLFASVDTPLIERMLLNLLSNALLHTPADGQVRLRLSRSGRKALLSVDDTGCGIPADRFRSVFSAYEERLDIRSLSSDCVGGLGLAICRRIAELHGGTVILESRPGRGTSVRVMLPLGNVGTVLRSDRTKYATNGLSPFLSALCDVLPTEVYGPDRPE